MSLLSMENGTGARADAMLAIGILATEPVDIPISNDMELI